MLVEGFEIRHGSSPSIACHKVASQRIDVKAKVRRSRLGEGGAAESTCCVSASCTEDAGRPS